jgi:Na+-transporting methylmalonyl-CoA/oxaloacetate decarboxylase gamma subunit
MYFALFTYLFKTKPSWISFLIGIFVVGTAAYILENVLYYDVFYSITISLLFVAPIVEEALKTSSLFYGKKIENALGIGLGFALAENFVYFMNFNSIYQFSTILVLFVVLRGIMDPAFHSLTASIDSYFYRNKWYLKAAPFASMLIHSGYNFTAIIIPLIFVSQQFYLYTIVAGVVILALSILLIKSNNVKEIESTKENEEVEEKKEPVKIKSTEDEKGRIETMQKTDVIEINTKSLQSFTESINQINQKYGFKKVLDILKLKYEPYTKTKWFRISELTENEKNSNIYIEFGLFGILALSVIIFISGYIIWFLFFS